MTRISGYLGAIAANGPVSLIVPSTITTAPAGITPDAPRRGSVIAYAPRMMMVSVIALHPCNSASPRSQAPGRIFAPPGSTANKPKPATLSHSNHPTPPKATMLFPVSLPSRGGDTQYVNMHEAYDDLPAATKERIDRLKAVHVYQSKYSPRELRPLSENSAKVLPPPGVHPLVRTHPENGRKALYLNPVRIES